MIEMIMKTYRTFMPPAAGLVAGGIIGGLIGYFGQCSGST
jgi:hypothetical protein